MEAQYFSQQQTSMEMFLREQQQEATANNNNGDGGGEGGAGMNNNASNIFFWSSHTGITYYGGMTTPMHTMNQVLTLETLEGDVAKSERKKRTEIAIEETSFVVKSGDIIFHNDIDENIDLDSSSSSSNNIHTTKPQKKSIKESKRSNDVNDNDNEVYSLRDVKDGMKYEEDIEEGINPMPFDIDDNNTVLQLPFSFVTRNNDDQQQQQQQQTEHLTRRTIPIVCAICLGNYEVGDSITCSPLSTIPSSVQQNQECETQTSSTTTVVTDESLSSLSSSLSCCPHAFHRDCITQWLSKRNDERPECPVCRRTFCTVVPITTADLTTLNTSAEGTAIATTTGATETLMQSTAASSLSDTNRTISMSVGQIPIVALPINNTSDRVMMILPTRSSNMVAFHGHHHRRTRDDREP